MSPRAAIHLPHMACCSVFLCVRGLRSVVVHIHEATTRHIEDELASAPHDAQIIRPPYVRIDSSGSAIAARHAGTMLRSTNGPRTAALMPRSCATSTTGVSGARG